MQEPEGQNLTADKAGTAHTLTGAGDRPGPGLAAQAAGRIPAGSRSADALPAPAGPAALGGRGHDTSESDTSGHPDSGHHDWAGDLALIKAAAVEAGQIALGFFRRDPKVWEKPDAAGPVTEADLAVDACLRDRLAAVRPDAGWLSEESAESPDRLAQELVFIVDPIDGTRAFMAGQKDWSISVALVKGGRPVAAVVHLPAHGRSYTATEGGPACLDGRPLNIAPAGSGPARILGSRRQFEPRRWRADPPPHERHFRSSLAYRLALVAEGRFDAMLALEPVWEWDVAAGVLIAERAGAAVTTMDGSRPRFNSAGRRLNGLVVAAPALQAALLDRLAPVGDAEPRGTV